MSVYLGLNDDDACSLLAAFQSGSVPDLGHLQSVRGAEEGYSNSVFFIETTTGSFVLKIYEPTIDGFALTSTEQKHQIQRRCGELGMRVPEVLGQLVDFRGRKAQLMRRVPGRSLDVLNPTQAEVLGWRAAEFQIGLQGIGPLCPVRRMNPAELLIGEFTACMGRLTLSSSLTEASYLRSLGGLALSFVLTRRKLETKRVPKGITHADMNRGNILFDDRGADVASFLDFDSIGHGFLLRDLVKLIYEFGVRIGNQGRFDIDDEIVAGLIRGYSGVRRLSAEELASIPAVLEMTSRWQLSSHLKLRLIGRSGEDLRAILEKRDTIKRLRKRLRKALRPHWTHNGRFESCSALCS